METNDFIELRASENTEPVKDSMELSDEDLLMDFKLRCAMQEKTPDVDQEFSRFEEEYLKPKLSRTLFKYITIAAIAASLVFFVIYNWQRNTPDTSSLPQLTADGKSFVSPPPMDDIEVRVGDKAISLGSKAADRQGIIMTSDSMVHFLSPDNVAPEDRNTITIPQGKVARIVLPDGSQVCLSARSRLIFPQRFLIGQPREVRLVGEGYFEVARDEQRPFIVHSGNVSTRVLGTQFNIRCFEGEAPCITLVSGSVKVSSPNSPGNDVILTPGQQATLSAQAAVFNITSANLDETRAWKEGLFCFEKTTLKDVLIEIARWYNLNVKFEDDEHIGDFVHYNGERSWNVREVLTHLNEISDAEITLKNNILTVR